MYKSFLSLILFCLILSSCKKEQNPYLIEKQNVGLLTDSTQVKDLKTIYSNDSIVNFIDSDAFTGNTNSIEIFEKGSQNLLLVLTPSQLQDSTAVIKSIRVMDSHFVTGKNISTLSTFKDISANYKISRIDNLINSVVVSVNEINASFTIDKKELPANLRFDMELKIEAIHIPDNAKIKYFFITWNKA
jgi:PBP1b-binding outer membrane lipoprotein LpoB